MFWNDYYENGLMREVNGNFEGAIDDYINAIEALGDELPHTVAALRGRIEQLRQRIASRDK